MPRHEAFRCTPILVPKVWGGDSLELLFGRKGHPGEFPFGESWELSDCPGLVDSKVAEGEFQGLSLHQLWENKRADIFGEGYEGIAHFPVLCKILDARESLSLQAHPSSGVAARRGGSEKNELWYVVGRKEEASMYLGLTPGVTASDVKWAVGENRLEELMQAYCLNQGDSVFIPSGMAHGLGGGYLVFEIQQNSDTTYRLYDWGREDQAGNLRKLHLEEAIECIEEFQGHSKPRPAGEGVLLSSQFFLIEECSLGEGDTVPHRDPDHFMIVTVVSGTIKWNENTSEIGDFILVPAHAFPLFSGEPGAKVLLTTVPI